MLIRIQIRTVDHRCMYGARRSYEGGRQKEGRRGLLSLLFNIKKNPVSTGMTLRGGMGREVGGGFKMGNTCTPMADSCQCMAKTTIML